MFFFSTEYIIIFCSIVWFISLVGFFLSYNFLIILIFFEIMFLTICTMFCVISYIQHDYNGQIFALFIFGVLACESALALSLYIVLNSSIDFLQNKKN